MKKYDYLIIGSGLFGAVFAQQAKAAGKKVLVVEKRPYTAGNVYTEEVEGITFSMDDFIRISVTGNYIVVKCNKKVESFSYPLTENITDGTIYEYAGPFYDPRGGGVPEATLINVSICLEGYSDLYFGMRFRI